jgi:hypothetical protein
MDSTHIRWFEESLERNTKREHYRKEEPKRAPVVPYRRSP